MASPTDWQTDRSFEKTNWHMFENGTLCDVTFLVGNEKKEEVKAHKFILASRSPVFYAMFCGSLAESSKTIQVPDIEPEMFRALLQFIYTEVCTINEDNVMSLLYSARKYETKRLSEKCQKFLNTKLSIDNVCVVLQHAHRFDLTELEAKCLQFIFENAENVLKSDGFFSIPKEVLGKILESDYLSTDELSVYEACKKWAVQQRKQKCNNKEYSGTELRHELGDLVYSIRFPIMSSEIFSEHVLEEDILTKEDKVICYFSRLTPGPDRKTDIHQFSNAKRVQKRQLRVSRFDSAGTSRWHYSDNSDAINFKVSRKCRLLGVSLFAPLSEGMIEGEISLRMGTFTLASKNDVSIKYELSKYDKDVLFDQPYTIEPDTEYTIYAILKGAETYSGSNGKQNISSGAIDVSFFKSDASTNYTSVDGGQIHSLILEVYVFD